MIGDSDDKINFPHQLLLTNREVANLPKDFANYLSTDIKLSSSSASHNNTVIIISNDEMKDIIKIVKSLEDSSLLPEGVSETIQNEAKEQRGAFLRMLFGKLGASFLGNIFVGKGINRAGERIVRAGYGNKRQDYEKKNGFLMPPHPLTNFEIQKYYQNEPRFNCVYSRDDLPRIKDGAYIVNLDEYSDIGTYWVALWVQNNDVTYFDSFGTYSKRD